MGLSNTFGHASSRDRDFRYASSNLVTRRPKWIRVVTAMIGRCGEQQVER
jgi:hypothetical protein